VHSEARVLEGVRSRGWGRSQTQMKVVILAGGFGQRLAWEILNDDKASAVYKEQLVRGVDTDTPYVASGLIKVRERERAAPPPPTVTSLAVEKLPRRRNNVSVVREDRHGDRWLGG
jgi:hypothetical protein